MSVDLNHLADLVAATLKAGASAADIAISSGDALSAGVRLGKIENLGRATGSELSLRAFVGQGVASVSTNHLAPDHLKQLVEQVVAMAKAAPPDPNAILATSEQLATNVPDLDLADPATPEIDWLLNQAMQAEDAARAVAGITNSEGAEAGFSRSTTTLVSSNGLKISQTNTRASLQVTVLGGTGNAMQRDYEFDQKIYIQDLNPADQIGIKAAQNTLKRLGAIKLDTFKGPVVFSPRVSRSIIGHLLGAINGSSIARKTSFLQDKMGQAIFGPHITIQDNPHLKRGLRSGAVDGEGLPTIARNLIDHGVLTSWLLDLRSAKQLGLTPTGHGSRSGASAHNVQLNPSTTTPAELMREIKRGFYVTELMGSGVNLITGDYSRGASGYLIENGDITTPIHEMTIAGHLTDMFSQLIPANDLTLRYGIDAPTLLVPQMTIGGN